MSTTFDSERGLSRIDFLADQLSQIQGMQFSLDLKELQTHFQDIEYGAFNEQNFGKRYLEDGILNAKLE